MIQSDILIIGAGPTGLFTVFEAGLLNLKCHLIDSLAQPGGQCAEIYPKKPIYDIPSHPEILAGDLVDNLLKQIQPFSPTYTLGECATTLEKTQDNQFIVTTDKGTKHQAPIVAIAGGLGTFEPRKPSIESRERFEDQGIDYIIKDPEKYRDKKVLIAGGGDSALDWAIYLVNVAAEVILIHRRREFRGALDSVNKVQALKDEGRIRLITPAELMDFHGNKHLQSVRLTTEEGPVEMDVDYVIPLFGLTPKLGPLKDWGFHIENNAIKVDNALDYQTNIPGIYAIGDVNTYPGKLKLILCGFHEATLMCHSAYKRLYPNKKNILKYTTVSGITGFDGTVKAAEKATIKRIE